MNHNYKKMKMWRSFSVLIICMLCGQGVWGQTTYEWRSEAANGNWFASTHWWIGSASTAGFGVMRFSNNSHLNMTVNNGESTFSTHAIHFNSGNTSVRTINGDAIRLFDFGGNDPYVLNGSSATHIINVNLRGDGDSGDPLLIRLNNSGGLSFNGTINNEGSNINVQGSTSTSNTVTFNGVISGNGGLFKANSNIVAVFNAANTFSGTNTIEAGSLRLGQSDASFGGASSGVLIGSAGILDLNGFNTTVRFISERGLANGGIVTLGSGTLTIQDNEVTTRFQSSINGSGGSVIYEPTVNSILSLYNAQGYTGTTTVKGGTFTCSGAMQTTSVIVEGGVFRVTGNNNRLAANPSITITGGRFHAQTNETITNLTISNSGTLEVDASRTLTINGTLRVSIGATLTVNGSIAFGTNGRLVIEGSGDYTTTNNIFPSSNGPRDFEVNLSSGTVTLHASRTLTGNLTLTSGTLNLGANTINRNSLGGSISLGAGTILQIGGTNGFPANYSGKTINATSTVVYNGTTQTVAGTGDGITYGNLELSGSGTKSFASTPDVVGNFVIGGTATVTPPSAFRFSGSSAQNIAGLAYNDIEFSGSGNKTFTSNASVSPESAISFGTGGATIDFDGTGNNLEFVLQSTGAGTARVGEVPSGWTLSGQVRAERYVQEKRAWRLITSPLIGSSNNSVNANWQATGSGTGLLLWNPQAQAGSGMETGTGIANIYRFGSPSAGWNAVSNTNTEELFNASSNNAFLVFATAPSDETDVSAVAQATTLRPKGNLRTGNVSRSINANTNALLSNPYASALDLAALKTDPDHSAFPTFWLLDPILNAFGGYVTFDGSDFVPNTNGTDTYTTSNTRIESGQAFFVRPNANTSFVFKESHKIGNGSHSMLRQNTMNQDFNSGIRVNLYKTIEDSFTIVDGILARFNQNESNDITVTDSRKFGNTNENIMFRTQNASLSIDKRSLPTLEDELSIRMTNTTANTVYQIRAFVESFENIPYQAFLLDTQTQQLTAIPMDGTSIIYPFTAMAATNAQPDDRFKIVFQDAPLSNEVTQQPILSLYPNPIRNGIVFLTLDSNSSDLTLDITNVHGQKVLNSVAENIGNGQFRVDLSSLSPGIYLLKASDSINQWMHKIAVH